MKPLIVLGSDHAGFRIKQFIEGLLVARCYRVEDVGTWSAARRFTAWRTSAIWA